MGGLPGLRDKGGGASLIPRGTGRSQHPGKAYLRVILILLLCLAGFKGISMFSGGRLAVHWNNEVYIAFGFHGNLYHSFRGDTNDESGFGKDIRIIRHIIRTLDRFNNQGVPVRASWDFDNHFSLERLLPKYAPDIIRDIRRRVGQGRDEVLIMSYNNGLASAMTRQELTDAVSWAISNPWGSGVKDIFGRYTPVVRPQEMMTSPGDFDVYKAAGIRAVSLYYSAVPFDAFRVFVRPLNREEAFNPLTYKNKVTAEKMTIIPTYNIGDLVENVSLKAWVEQLHRMQRHGLINRDVLIFINFDADSEFWTGGGLKWPLNRLPNTKGLAGLIREVKDLNYVRFTTLDEYLQSHGPAGTVSFQQDTADGSFDGYNSWAEKHGATEDWTRIVRARRISGAASKAAVLLGDDALASRIRPLTDEAYQVRLAAMSTTNFGMSTPFVSPRREVVMKEMLDRLDCLAGQVRASVEQAVAVRMKRLSLQDLPEGWIRLGGVMLVSPGQWRASRFMALPRSVADGGRALYLKSVDDGAVYGLVPLPGAVTEAVRTYIDGPAPDGFYTLCSGPKNRDGKPVTAAAGKDGARLENGRISLSLDAAGKLSNLTLDGQTVLAPGSLLSWFRYGGRRFVPDRLEVRVAAPGEANGAALAVRGAWRGPEGRTLSGGEVEYRYSLVRDLPYLFVGVRIRYPTTASTDVIKADSRALAREMDLGWEETAPLELRLRPGGGLTQPVRVLKSNYMGVDTGFDLDYFRHAPENRDIDNVNNQITGGYVGLAAGGNGVALSFDPYLAVNFAGAPVKVRYDETAGTFNAALNPLGTYHGRQNLRPTWGNGQGTEAALISGEQYHSAAPTYNGRISRLALMIAFFKGDSVPDRVGRILKAHAESAVVFGLSGRSGKTGAIPGAPVEYSVSMDRGRVVFSWERASGQPAEYAVRIGTRPGQYLHVFRTTATQMVLDGLSPHQPFEKGRTYYAVIDSAGADGGIPVRTREIRLVVLDANRIAARPEVPWQFPLKVIWANIKAFFR